MTKHIFIEVFEQTATEKGIPETTVLKSCYAFDYYENLGLYEPGKEMSALVFQYLLVEDKLPDIFKIQRKQLCVSVLEPLIDIQKENLGNVIEYLPGKEDVATELINYIMNTSKEDYRRFFKFCYYWCLGYTQVSEEFETKSRLENKQAPLKLLKSSGYEPIEGHVELIDFLSNIIGIALKQSLQTEVYTDMFYYITEVRKKRSLSFEVWNFLVEFLEKFQTIEQIKKVNLDLDEYLCYDVFFTDFMEWIQKKK